MAEYSSSVDDDPNQINSDCDFMSFLKFPFEDCKSKEIMNNIESKYLLWTGDGQLLWVRYSLDSAPAVTDSSSSLVVIRSKDPHDGNIITLSSYENFSVCEDEVPDEYDINTDVDNMLKVEDRVKVYDAILAPAEKQASVKCKKRVSSREDEEQIGSYVCDLCGSSFVRAVQYYGHLHLHSGDYLWECRLCPEGSRFGSQFQLRRHEKRYHVNLRPHTCSQCGASFDRPSQLDYHKRRIHEGERPHSCQLCGKAFFKHSDLRTHLNTHLSVHGSMCEICGRRFSHISNLTRHIRIHSGVKPYPCSVCGRRFNQLNSLNEHKAVHVNWVPVSCCGKVFKTQVMFRKHLKSVHQTNNMLQQACVTKRQFHCKVCGCSFPFLTLLRKHEMKHNQFACSGCKKDLKSLAELKDHSCSKEKVLEAEDECEFNYEQDINDRQILGDMYLDSDTDWINPQAIVRSGSEKFDESISPLREVQYALSCDILDESAPLCCTEVDMELKGQVQACKPVENTCCEVSLDDSAEEVKSVVTPLDAVNSGLLMVIPQTLPEHSPNYTSQLTCDSFVSPSVFEHSIPSGGTDSLDGYSINEYSAAVIVKEADKCLTNGKSLNDNYINESNSERVAEECPSDGSNKPVNVEISSKKHKDKNCNDDKTTKRYTCSVCNKQFLKACNFRQHQGIHDIGRQLYRCKVCGRSFAWKSTLNKHILSHSENPNPTIFMCHMCDKLYTSSSVLQAHINRDHLKKRPHICSVCKKSFFKKYDLKIHLRTHTNERPYICGTCGRGFGHISHLIRHERIHSGQRPYQCSFCPASFIQSSSLTSHQKHHVNKPDHSVCYLEFVMERPKSNES